MWASMNGRLDIVRTLLEYGVAVEAKDKVRNQMVMKMMMTIMIVLNIVMIMMKMISINDKDRDDYR
jgi:hypothetical protein